MIDKAVEGPMVAVERSIVEPVQKWAVEQARSGSAAGAFAGALALSALKFGEGLYEGVSAVPRPWAWANAAGETALYVKQHGWGSWRILC